LTLEEIQDRLKSWNQPAYRARQLLEWIYRRQAGSWEVMSNLPLTLRERLRAEFTCDPLRLERRQGARDTTRKYLWRLQDSSFVESVLIPANPALYGDPSDRHTLCVSTQVGCAYGCKFCASGLKGWKRNLAVEEIVGQVLGVEREENPWHPSGTPSGEGAPQDADAARLASSRLVSNLVIMGMGEPLANYENLLKALKILNAPWGAAIGARKITISTSGLVPQIRRLADEPLQFRLAISLHGATIKPATG
jgi:23S rRNA (adenine2503-C2)-methyltransferase